MMIKTIITAAFLFILAFPVLAAPGSQYWGVWDKSDDSSKKTINHQVWQDLLDRYLVSMPNGSRFRYIRVTEKDRQALQNYLKELSGLDPRQFNKSEQKAYWINFYNALTVELILKNYPVKSITKLGGWFKFGPWDEKVTEVAGLSLTLNDIEHRILRPLWNDKRIHYAVNCASLGCPDLAEKAYTGGNVEQILETQTERFIRQEKAISWIDGRLVLSRIYEWYEDDFGSGKELIRHFRQYSTPAQSRRLERFTGIIDYQYNWSLNELK